MNNLPDQISLERMERHPFLMRELARFIKKSFRIIKQIKESNLPDKDIILRAYMFHRSHQFSDINISMLDDELKHDISCRVISALVKKAAINES